MLVAAAGGSVCLALLCGVVTGLVLLWTFAPWIPHLQSHLTIYKRRIALEDSWLKGQALRGEPVRNDKELESWLIRRADWDQDTTRWIEMHISRVAAQSFQAPTIMAADVTGSYSVDHSKARNALDYKLEVLLGLRDDQNIAA